MNIFILEKTENGNISWIKSGRALDNKRIVKMILESCQLLSTSLNLLGLDGCYKTTHKNHPASIWVRESFNNFKNLTVYSLFMCKEYTERFNKTHACRAKIIKMFKIAIANKKIFPQIFETNPVFCMPDEFKSDDIVESYREYYSTKDNIVYPARRIPKWFLEKRTKIYKVKLVNGTIIDVVPKRRNK